MILLVAVAVALVAGSVLLAVGLRGRRVDDHRLCRGCGYDLTGTPDAARCTECGRDLGRKNATRVGHRERRRGLIYGGLAVLLPTLLTIAGLVISAYVSVDWQRHKPEWLLRRELSAELPYVNGPAFAELSLRLNSGGLGDESRRALADVLLTLPARLWERPRHDNLAAALRAEGFIGPEEWRVRNAREVGTPSLWLPSVRLGFEPQAFLHFEFALTSLMDDQPMVLRLNDLRVNGEPVPWQQTLTHPNAGVPTFRAGFWSDTNGDDATFLALPEAVRQLPVGEHSVEVTAQLTVFSDVVTLRPGDPPPDPLLTPTEFEAMYELVGSIAILPPRREEELTTVDPALRDAVERSVFVSPVLVHPAMGPRGTTGMIFVRVDAPPVDLVFDVAVRPAGDAAREIHVGEIDVRAGRSLEPEPFSVDAALLAAPGAAAGNGASVDVVLTPLLEWARQRTDDAPIWGEPVVIRGIPVADWAGFSAFGDVPAHGVDGRRGTISESTDDARNEARP